MLHLDRKRKWLRTRVAWFHKAVWAFPSDKFANHISNSSDFDISDLIEIQNRIDLWSYQLVNCICTKKETGHHNIFHFFQLVLKWVWHDKRDSCNVGHCLLTVWGWFPGVRIRENMTDVAIWLSSPALLSRWVLCISMQWPGLKDCHVTCDECTSGEMFSLHTWCGQSRVAGH